MTNHLRSRRLRLSVGSGRPVPPDAPDAVVNRVREIRPRAHYSRIGSRQTRPDLSDVASWSTFTPCAGAELEGTYCYRTQTEASVDSPRWSRRAPEEQRQGVAFLLRQTVAVMGVTAGCIRRDPRSLPGGWIGSMARTVGDSWTLPWWALPLRAVGIFGAFGAAGPSRLRRSWPGRFDCGGDDCGHRRATDVSRLRLVMDRSGPCSSANDPHEYSCVRVHRRNAIPRHCCRRCSHRSA